MLCGGNFGMQLQPHVIGLQRIFYTVNPVQVSGGGEQNVWGGEAASFGGQLPPLTRPRTATARCAVPYLPASRTVTTLA